MNSIAAAPDSTVLPTYIVRIQHYSLEQGLPNRGLVEIEQDHDGFIWLGTFDNAYQFDGYRFRGLPASKPTGSSKLTSVVNAIRNDSEGNLWFFKFQSDNYRSLDILSPGKQRPESYEKKFHSRLPCSLDGIINYTRCPTNTPSKATLYIPTESGEIWRYTGHGHFKRIYKPLKVTTLINLFEAPNGRLLLTISHPKVGGYSFEMLELDADGRVYKQWELPAKMLPVWVDAKGGIYLHRFFFAEEQDEWAPQRTTHALNRFLYRLSSDGRLAEIPINYQQNPFPEHYDLHIDRIFYDAYHQLFWYLGRNVLWAWHPTQGIVFDLGTSGFPVGKLSSMSQLFFDRTGAVWVATQNGALLLTLQPSRFQQYLAFPDKDTKINRLSMRGITQIGDYLWVNAVDTWIVNLKTGKREKLIDKRPIDRRLVTAMNIATRGHDGQFWGGAERLISIDPVSYRVKQYPFHAPTVCWAIWQDGRHNFWLGHDQGLSFFNWQKKQNVPFTRYNQYRELEANRVNGFFPDTRAGGIWVASSAGLYLLDTLRGIKARYSTSDAYPNQLPYDHITFVHPDPTQPDLYWLATRGGGLIRWERNTGRYRQFTQAEGLPNNTLYAVYEDHWGRLWLPSNYGLISFQKNTFRINNFLPKDGVTHEEFNLTSHFQAADGRLFVGGLNGITAFYPDDITEAKLKPAPLVVTQYQLLDMYSGNLVDYLEVFKKDKKIVMQPDDRSFVLGFSVLNYQFINGNRLWYRIIGWQPKWTVQNDLELRVNGLPPGTYQLQIRVQNANGQWISHILTIPVIVIKPIYLRGWFLAFTALLVFMITVLLFRWRNSKLTAEKKQLEQEVARRTAQIANDKAIIEQQAADLRQNASQKARFFANVTHEFRTPLTLLLGPIKSLNKRITDPELRRLLVFMERNARNLLELVNDLLDLSKMDAGQMQLIEKATDVVDLIARTVATFESQANFIEVSLAHELPEHPIWLMLDVQKVETVLKNIVSNALRFTPAGGKITVTLYDQDCLVQISVKDTGIGIHQNDLPFIFDRYYQSQQVDGPLRGGTGIGLALARDYCRLWGGKLTVDSQLNVGSTFSFTYPKHPVASTVDKLPQSIKSPMKDERLSLEESVKEPVASGETILLVEDNADMLAYLEFLLKPFYRLQIARNGKEACQWLNSQPLTKLPQLILSDVMMPEMSGLDMAEEIRTNLLLRNIPLILLSARTQQETRLQALRLGVADYLTKPFDEEELLTRITNLLERARERAVWREQLIGETANPQKDDDVWLVTISQLIQDNLTNSQFQVPSLAEAMHISERQIYRRIKELTGLSPNQYIQEVRLQMAYQWLSAHKYSTVKEVCFAVGFYQVPYFSRLFQQRFGITPGSLLVEKK